MPSLLLCRVASAGRRTAQRAIWSCDSAWGSLAIAAGCLTWLASGTATAAGPSTASALQLQPVQKGVPFQEVAAADAEQCKVEDLKENGWTGWAVVTADGLRLRRFADTNDDKKIDLWCYYDQGVEIYRDVDSDFNGKADEYRWMGTAGTRWGIDADEDGEIDRWKQISAEEVSAEVIAALATGDAKRFNRLLASEAEIKSLQLGEETTGRIAAKAAKAADSFAEFAAGQKVVGPKSRWLQFASSTPGVVPAGTQGSKKDLKVYENAVAMFDGAEQGGQVIVGTLIQVGEAWRLIDLPQVLAADDTATQITGNFFTAGMSLASNPANRSGISGDTQELVVSLEKIDRELSTAAKPADQADLNRRRVDVVEKLISTSSDTTERDTWMRQLVDTVSVAVQNGTYPDGLVRLRKFSSELPATDEALQAYVKFQIISTEYVQKQTPDADFAKVQEWYLTELTKFVDEHPTSPEAAQALLQLALSKEFEEKETEAIEFYARVAKSFPGTDMAEKATGAVRRLESTGKSLPLRGMTIQGQPFDLAKLQGKPVVIHYWATWCEACKQDMKLLRQLQAKYQSAGLQIVGINVDSARNQATTYLQSNPAPWIHLFEDGGLESSGLAKQLGVQTLPMMLLIDGSGKVVANNIHAASLDTELAKIARPAPKGK